MNFLCKLSKFRFIFFCAASFNIINFLNLSAQYKESGLACIQEIIPFSSPDISQYNSIVQDSKGFFFIGGNNGLLAYDGNHWQQLNLNGPVSVCNGSEDKIIAYGKNYFGYVEYQPDGDIHFFSLYQSENDIQDTIGTILKIWSFHENLVLQTSSGVFTWNQDRLIKINLPGLPASVTCKGDSLLMHIPDKGLFIMYNNTVQPLNFGENPEEGHVVDIIDFNNQVLLYTEEKGFMIFRNGKIEIFNPEINKYLAENGYNDGITDNKGNFIFSTKKGSLILYNRMDGAINYYDTQNGLSLIHI